ncbi:hypothetical protein ACQEUU_29555 [Nonomuraea sp. CA-218870]|uniref:hypothetical protein n=1 Tax=Nonomuraea sp. CA-218870 TaxID=3239998 RepID=UPI003D9114EF
MTGLTFTGSQHKLLLPPDTREAVNSWIKQQAVSSHRSPDQTAFSRLIDFWFMSIAWAVHHDLKPAEKATGKQFVNLGPNQNDIRMFEDWRGDLLTVLAVYEFGHDSKDASDVRKVIDLANRYAEVGAPALLEVLREQDNLAMPKLYVAADIFSLVVEENSHEYRGLVF